jgi:hypothetical protein
MLSYVKTFHEIPCPALGAPIKIEVWTPIRVIESATVAGTPEPPGTPLRIKFPGVLFTKRPNMVEVNGTRRQLSACVCTSLAPLRTGGTSVRMRPETYMRVERELPELLPLLRRDQLKKPVAKVVVYRVHGVSVA